MRQIVVISVLYRSADRLDEWADALDRERASLGAAATLDVIAVDNASHDGAAARLRARSPWIRVIEQKTNSGFAAGCNLGLERVPGDALVVLLNPDTVLSPGFMLKLAKMPWPDDLAAIGPQVRGSDGSIEQSARAFPTIRTGIFGRTAIVSKLLPHSRMVRAQLFAEPSAGVRSVDWISGACLIAPADRFRLTGPLDERFWMYWEDADWCRRSHNQGLRIEYHPEFEVRHHQGSSSATLPVRTTLAFHRSALRYYRLHVARSRTSTSFAALLLGVRCVLKLGLAATKRLRWRNQPL